MPRLIEQMQYTLAEAAAIVYEKQVEVLGKEYLSKFRIAAILETVATKRTPTVIRGVGFDIGFHPSNGGDHSDVVVALGTTCFLSFTLYGMNEEAPELLTSREVHLKKTLENRLNRPEGLKLCMIRDKITELRKIIADECFGDLIFNLDDKSVHRSIRMKIYNKKGQGVKELDFPCFFVSTTYRTAFRKILLIENKDLVKSKLLGDLFFSLLLRCNVPTLNKDIDSLELI